MAGLVRPAGPVRIEKTKLVSRDMLVARLSGPVKGTVAVVRKGEDFFFARPKELGGKVEKVAADSLTDCLHQAVFDLNNKIVNTGSKKGKILKVKTASTGGCGA
jgi:hypothetical protein